MGQPAAGPGRRLRGRGAGGVHRRAAQAAAVRRSRRIATWLYGITVRVVQEWRRRRRWWSWVTRTRAQPEPRPRATLAPLAGEGAPDPVARLEVRERVLRLLRILDGLGEVYRTTFILFEDGRSLGRAHRRDLQGRGWARSGSD